MSHAEKAALAEKDEFGKEKHIHKQGAEGNVVGREEDAEKDDHAHDHKVGVEREDQSGRGGNAFAAAEAHVKGKVMTEDRACRRVDAEQIDNVGAGRAEQKARGADRKDAFHAVAEQDDKACLFAEHAERVGRSGVVASVVADVDALCLSIKVGCLKQAEHITDRQTNNSFHYKVSHLFFHFRVASPRNKYIVNFPDKNLFYCNLPTFDTFPCSVFLYKPVSFLFHALSVYRVFAKPYHRWLLQKALQNLPPLISGHWREHAYTPPYRRT